MAARACGDAPRQAAASRAGLDRPHRGRRAYGCHDDAGAGGLERQGKTRARLASGPSIMALRVCRHREAKLCATIRRLSAAVLEHDPEKWSTGFPKKIMLKQKDRAG